MASSGQPLPAAAPPQDQFSGAGAKSIVPSFFSSAGQSLLSAFGNNAATKSPGMSLPSAFAGGPTTKKMSTIGGDDRLAFAVSATQGWRKCGFIQAGLLDLALR